MFLCLHFPLSISYCSSSLGPDGSLAPGRLGIPMKDLFQGLILLDVMSVR